MTRSRLLALLLLAFFLMTGSTVEAAGEPCGPGSADTCGADEFCKLPIGDCGTTGVAGVCTVRPQGCFENYDPVCGCNSETYGNECEADQAGVSIAFPGECPQGCGGIAGIPCDGDDFCLYPDGFCNVFDAGGFCVPAPQNCPAIYDPVCSCDGHTYGNQCEAVAAGVQIDHRGECNQVCGSIAGIPCDEGEYCRLPFFQCNVSDLQGVCVPAPGACPEIYDPVCGCDGETYDNACFADQAGAQMRHPGKCPLVCGGIAGVPCDEDEYCKFPDGTCDIQDNQGICVGEPQACPDVWDPVCGCDGRTYGNRCEAATAGVSIDREGECARICGGIAGLPCDEGEFCKLPAGGCHISDLLGVCEPIPDACPEIYDPVCGCDGQTYSNACFADLAGAQIDHDGECEQFCGGIAGIPCDEGEYCMFPDGACHIQDSQGVCRPIPQGCPDVWDPVCGCDGRTYGNRCEAAAAGVSIDSEGECVQICGGIAGLPCDEREFCKLPAGECHVSDLLGVCQPVPDACPEIYDPVCGCDGQTYSNACFADLAGAQIDHDGECEQFCGGIAGTPCDEGEYCMFPDGACHIQDSQGVCRPIPQGCPDVWDPVCGCDGQTYGNRCEAAAAGVSIDSEGECVQICGGIAGLPCDEGEFCKLPAGQCHISDLLGVCQPIVDACPEIYDPVCGCDGQTYSNACFADLAGAQIDHDGECEQFCGGIAGTPCDEGEYCMFPDGACHIQDSQGVCRPIPQGCPDVWDPVCGCDGQTYGNRCEAAAAGVSIDSEGECVQICGGIAGLPCDKGEFCKLPAGECHVSDLLGVCQPIPITCPLFYDPVCGCDGVTYNNECDADLAGAQIDHPGECERCGGIAGFPCDEGEYCRFPNGTCSYADHFGTCVTIPETCPEICHPVCSCDGITYGNECLAEQSLASLDHRGECDPTGRLIQKVRFDSHERMRWQPAPGAASYNVYVEVHETPPPMDAGECYASGLARAGVIIDANPGEGQAWLIQVTGMFSDGEGSMGMSSDCTFRVPEIPCDPQ